MKKINVKEVTEKLNKRFSKSLLMFEAIPTGILPTIAVKLKDDKYLRDDQFSTTDKFREDLMGALNKMGFTDVSFNNTGRVFWWVDENNE
jgi:hypothetical protein